MANLLTRKVMDNIARQYRKENVTNSSSSMEQESNGNIDSREEALLLGLINSSSTNPNSNNIRYQKPQEIKKIKLENLIEYSKQPAEENQKCSFAISLEELANKQSK
ncbi:hypothetical protein KQI88_07090 [Alkaliphilus sp. MSJ-5]|uniref:Uncharacterized protein n=1 Tax=Alkaliphilus flagellatus TaxID=2841507 RepID=A0ABS6G112_9FIRM|nr:hypothetical protein [Alkaliphilus flagellatus]MBU5676177.1 hypothetical protein [Alkaliphilus flagellatus]